MLTSIRSWKSCLVVSFLGVISVWKGEKSNRTHLYKIAKTMLCWFVCLLVWGFYACVVVIVAAGDFWVGSFIFIFDNFYFVLKGNKIPAALHLFLALHPL